LSSKPSDLTGLIIFGTLMLPGLMFLPFWAIARALSRRDVRRLADQGVATQGVIKDVAEVHGPTPGGGIGALSPVTNALLGDDVVAIDVTVEFARAGGGTIVTGTKRIRIVEDRPWIKQQLSVGRPCAIRYNPEYPLQFVLSDFPGDQSGV